MKNRSTKKAAIGLAVLMFSMGMIHVAGQDVGSAAPDFEVNLLGGETFKLSDHQGKVVFVFFFGNTCPNCKAVGPEIEASIYQAFKDNDDFVAVGLDTWDSSSGESSVTGFKNATGITFPLAIKAGFVASDYSTTYDRLLVIDRDGVLAHKGVVGAVNDVDNAIEAIEESLITAGIFRKASGKPEVKLYPVPASDVIHFETDESISTIRIHDASGRLVLEDAPGLVSNRRSVQVGELKRGLYFYTLQHSGGMISGKFLIQR